MARIFGSKIILFSRDQQNFPQPDLQGGVLSYKSGGPYSGAPHKLPYRYNANVAQRQMLFRLLGIPVQRSVLPEISLLSRKYFPHILSPRLSQVLPDPFPPWQFPIQKQVDLIRVAIIGLPDRLHRRGDPAPYRAV